MFSFVLTSAIVFVSAPESPAAVEANESKRLSIISTEDIRALAEKGDRLAQWELGKRYIEGPKRQKYIEAWNRDKKIPNVSIDFDRKLAQKWLTESCLQGWGPSMWELSKSYNGLNNKEAYAWLFVVVKINHHTGSNAKARMQEYAKQFGPAWRVEADALGSFYFEKIKK